MLDGTAESLKLWDAQSGAEQGSWNCGWPVQCVAFHPDEVWLSPP